ncbi:nuclear transcription factor Y subunit B-7-like [Coffea arabica]|uniref:Nuclear transcription factor Y subunit B-7-like n=1 Tax=Coffea arabica TaxID=13443 RepID=A0A6P6TD63_COFAR|nr:nuclear transcription factor Y subunit B-7-like [Coffea arabica]
MADERCGIGPNVPIKGSLENQCSLSSSSNTNNDNNNNNSSSSLSIATVIATYNHHNNNNSNNNNGSSSSCGNNSNNNKEQDRFLPIANVGRIMKKVIPGNGKISKDAKETVQECVSEFISFVTGEASDKCQREKRKTINGDDIIWAITTLGFEDYVTPLKQYLSKYRELEGEKLNVPKQQQQQQQQQQHHQRLQNHDQNPIMSPYHSVYSSTNLLSQPPFVPSDQPFALPFSQSSIQTQLPQQEHIDSVGHW